MVVDAERALNMALQRGLRRNFSRDFTYSSTSVAQSHASTCGDPAAISDKACTSTTSETCRSGVISARVLSTWTATAMGEGRGRFERSRDTETFLSACGFQLAAFALVNSCAAECHD